MSLFLDILSFCSLRHIQEGISVRRGYKGLKSVKEDRARDKSCKSH